MQSSFETVKAIWDHVHEESSEAVAALPASERQAKYAKLVDEREGLIELMLDCHGWTVEEFERVYNQRNGGL